MIIIITAIIITALSEPSSPVDALQTALATALLMIGLG
jgi:hypothetical protein